MTLLEVLIAMVILSITAAGLVLATLDCMAVIRVARQREVARALMVRIDLENPIESVDMSELYDSGTFEDEEGFSYSWIREILMVDQEERPGLFMVNKRILWSERGQESFVEVQEYVYAPDAEVVTSEI